MPTYRIVERVSSRVVVPSRVADSEFSALAGFLDSPDGVEYEAVLVSVNPPAMVFTVVRQEVTARGVEVVEVCTTGDRETALRESIRANGNGGGARSIVEETVAMNRVTARGRRS